ncbi:MAG TPA: hypothetical protein VL486_15495 [Verrucomicrobiae bacterium]|nr:hypothetical protein [Verrucomicrobiae bacterium]
MKTLVCALSVPAVVGGPSVVAGADGYASWEGVTNYIVTGGPNGPPTTVTSNKAILGPGTDATLVGDFRIFYATNVPARFYRIRLVP